jgi:hypothetical protein
MTVNHLESKAEHSQPHKTRMKRVRIVTVKVSNINKHQNNSKEKCTFATEMQVQSE